MLYTWTITLHVNYISIFKKWKEDFGSWKQASKSLASAHSSTEGLWGLNMAHSTGICQKVKHFRIFFRLKNQWDAHTIYCITSCERLRWHFIIIKRLNSHVRKNKPSQVLPPSEPAVHVRKKLKCLEAFAFKTKPLGPCVLLLRLYLTDVKISVHKAVKPWSLHHHF